MSQNSEYDLESLPEHPEKRVAAWATITGRVRNGDEQPTPSKEARNGDFKASQWTLGGPDKFFASGTSFGGLPAGFYRVEENQRGVYAQKQSIVSDKLSVLPGSCNAQVLNGIRKFWESKETYAKYGLAYKRGVLFYGPPGSGKTATLTLLAKELIKEYGGAVFVCQSVELLTHLLQKLRQIEPQRPLIVELEDIDEIISNQGEHGILALLDGEMQIDNVVFIATTNYPDRLGARIVNRPARFDQRVFVDMPSTETRRAYLQIVSEPEPLTGAEISKWARDTDGMSIAHLRELFIAVRCLGNPYDEVIRQLKSMAVRPKSKEGMGSPIGISIAS